MKYSEDSELCVGTDVGERCFRHAAFSDFTMSVGSELVLL